MRFTVTGLLIWLGPRSMHVSEERTGDPELSARLAEAAGSGHHHLSAVLIDVDGARFAGLGADEHTEFESGSVTKTFTAHILAERGPEETTVGLRSTAADMARYATFVSDSGIPDYTWSTDEQGRRVHHGGTYGYSTTLIIDEANRRTVYVAGDTGTRVGDVAASLLEVK